MKQRNGAGSRRLIEATQRFIRSEQKLLEVLGDRRILKKAETAHFAKDLDVSAAKKRSSDVFASAISINRKIMAVLERSKGSRATRSASDLDILQDIGKVAHSVMDPAIALREMLALLKSAAPYENASVFIMNRAEGSLEEAATVGEPVDLIAHVRFDRGRGFSSWVAQQRKPVLLNDLHRDDGPGATSVRSFLSVPIVVQGDVIGVINMSHPRPGVFDEETARRVGLLALPMTAVVSRAIMLRESDRLATLDTVTSLYNRRHFDRHLIEEIGRARRYGHKVSVVAIGIDTAKSSKPRQRGRVADQLLVEMAKLLKRAARGTDCVARYSGEEFRILLPQTDLPGARVAAERFRTLVERESVPRRRRLSVNVDVVTYPDAEAVDPRMWRGRGSEPISVEPTEEGTEGAAVN